MSFIVQLFQGLASQHLTVIDSGDFVGVGLRRIPPGLGLKANDLRFEGLGVRFGSVWPFNTRG